MRRLRGGDAQASFALALLGARAGVRVGVRAVGHAHDDRAPALGGEVAVAELGHRQELVQVVAFHHRAQIWSLRAVGVDIRDVAVVALLDESPVVAADVRAVAGSLARETLS